jgi:hypothetical protein
MNGLAEDIPPDRRVVRRGAEYGKMLAIGGTKRGFVS